MTDRADLPAFDEPALAAAVERLSPADIDRLPFGVIRLDRQGVVDVYNETERRLSGSGDRPRLGLDFFTRVAPCLDTDAFRGRMERAREADEIDLEFTFLATFDAGDRALTVRMLSASTGGCWIFQTYEAF